LKRPTLNPESPSELERTYKYDNWEFFGDPEGRMTPPEYRSRYMSRFSWVINMVQRYVPEGSSILDMAAGSGNFGLTFADMGYLVTWNDLRPYLEDYVTAKDDSGRMSYHVGDAFGLASAMGRQFDCVVATEVIEHVAHPDQFIRNIASLLRPEGIAVMTTPSGSNLINSLPGKRLPRWSDFPDHSFLEEQQFRPDGDGHLFLLYEDEIRRFAADGGFKVEEFDYISNMLTAGRLKSSYLHRILPTSWIERGERWSRQLPKPAQRKVMDILAFVLRKA
jgi:SAM-dependent methyltransferase